ncbi:dTDP-glucose 4,6-dehydratase, partial [bacterium]|nr:dTDP-glucose 4,6-dehydratase [bacterium]
DRRYAIDVTKIRKELSWQPSVDFENGIKATVDWYLQNYEWINTIIDGSCQEYYQKIYADR